MRATNFYWGLVGDMNPGPLAPKASLDMCTIVTHFKFVLMKIRKANIMWKI